jgi:hypothetical protein
MVQILFIDIPPFEIAWIVFSIILSILVLKKREGARYAIWLIPLITALYGFQNMMQGTQPMDPDLKLFPSTINANSLNELKTAWQKYLIQEWGHEQPSLDPEQFQSQLERGDFAFNVERLIQRTEQGRESLAHQLWHRESNATLLIYLLWNLIIASVIFIKTSESR